MSNLKTQEESILLELSNFYVAYNTFKLQKLTVALELILIN